MTTIAQLTADLTELNTALNVVEAQTICKGFPLRKEEEALYIHLMTNLEVKHEELQKAQEAKFTMKSFIPNFKKN